MKTKGLKLKSGVQVLLDPEQIVAASNSRWDGMPLDPYKVEEMCRDYEKNGQLQAVRVRPVGSEFHLVFGFTRHAAALLFNERHPEKAMKLKVISTGANAEEALEQSIAENHVRNATSPMDDAFAQKRLREEFGWTDARISELYHVSPTIVNRLKFLLSLPKKVQKQVHLREISVDAAVNLASLPENEREEVMANVEADHAASETTAQNGPPAAPGSATATPTPQSDMDALLSPNPNGKPKRKASKSAKITSAVRDKKIEKGGALPRTLSQVKAFWTDLSERSEGERKDLCKLVLKHFAGSIGDKAMEKRVGELVK